MHEKKGTDYSAFGAPMPGRSYSSSSYRYGFNGKEKIDEITASSGTDYDFGARIYDARLGRWLSIDPFAAKYPAFSPYSTCLDNPSIFFDSDGKEVKPMGENALAVITDGLSAEEAQYVRLDANGSIDKIFLQQGKTDLGTIGENYSSLLSLVESETITEVYVQRTITSTLGTEDPGTISYEAELDVMYDITKPPITKEEYAKQNPDFGAAKTWSGSFGLTLYGDEDTGHGLSTTGNNQIFINDSYSANISAEDKRKKMASTFAHEAYGHVLFKLEGKPHSHGDIKSLSVDDPTHLLNNKELEIQIYARENEAEANCEAKQE